MMTSNDKIIHVAKVRGTDGRLSLIFLKEENPHSFVWFKDDLPTEVARESIEEAIKAARLYWKEDFVPVRCGFRYTLPERDEHGGNALFYQMAASLNSMNGVYFDEELGHSCFVQGMSLEARDLYKTLKVSH